jgi:5'-3' exonuclease
LEYNSQRSSDSSADDFDVVSGTITLDHESSFPSDGVVESAAEPHLNEHLDFEEPFPSSESADVSSSKEDAFSDPGLTTAALQLDVNVSQAIPTLVDESMDKVNKISDVASNSNETHAMPSSSESRTPETLDFSPTWKDPQEELVEAIMTTCQQEEEQFTEFMSTLQSKSKREVQYELNLEKSSLEARMKSAKRDADTVTSDMVDDVKALLTLFGIPYITAPFEAEAQCAWLCSSGLVDGVVTDDSDAFLFGASLVYKNMFNNAKYVECYKSLDIERNLQLDRSCLIALAQLLGSDYAPGIPGCGAVTAMEILSEFRQDATESSGILKEFSEWSRMINADKSNPIRRRLRKIASKVPHGNFPDTKVEEAYLFPIVDQSLEPFSWGTPDIEGLKGFLWEKVHWAPSLVDSTVAPLIATMNSHKLSLRKEQTSLLDYFQETDVRARTKPMASKRMRKAIESHRNKVVEKESQAAKKRQKPVHDNGME